MKILLDTCAVIWWFIDDPRLGREATRVIEDPVNDIHVSIVSFWEIAVKHRLGRLDMPVSVLDRTVRQAGWPLLAVLPTHLTELELLPAYHRDPFDHLLISQAISERLAIMTADEQIARYPVECVSC